MKQLPRGINPSALILCSSSSEVLEVHFLCTKFLENYKTIKSVAAINGKSERSLVVSKSLKINLGNTKNKYNGKYFNRIYNNLLNF